MQKQNRKGSFLDSSGLIFRRRNQNYFIVKYRLHFHLDLALLSNSCHQLRIPQSAQLLEN